MSTKQYPTAEYLWQCFRYEDGKLFWIERPLSHFKNKHGQSVFNGSWPGKEAGCLSVSKSPGRKSEERWVVSINNVPHLRYRIVWVMHYGDVSGEIDHKNRIPTDDRVENLRPCTRHQNSANSSLMLRSTSGIRGVCWVKADKKWRASIFANGKFIHLGCFKEKEDAIEARVKASKLYFGEFSNEEIGHGNHKPTSNSQAGIGTELENRAEQGM